RFTLLTLLFLSSLNFAPIAFAADADDLVEVAPVVVLDSVTAASEFADAKIKELKPFKNRLEAIEIMHYGEFDSEELKAIERRIGLAFSNEIKGQTLKVIYTKVN